MNLTHPMSWWLIGGLVLLFGIVQLGMPETGFWLRYEHSLISDGQFWRLFTAHWVHLGWGHVILNSGGLLLVYGLYSHWLTPSVLLGWTAISAVAVGAGLYSLSPEIIWYVGFSGILHGLLVAGAVSDISTKKWEGTFIIVLVMIKLIWEQVVGALPGSASAAGGPVVVDAHLYGAIGGLAGVLLQWVYHRAAK